MCVFTCARAPGFPTWHRGGRVLRFKRVEHAWNTRRIIRQNPRKVRGVHALRGKVASLMVYYY